MYTPAALLDLHERAHHSLEKLLAHCRQLSAAERDGEMDGFGYPSVRAQIHHIIGAEEYWIGVLQGRLEVDENDSDYPTIEKLELYRKKVFSATQKYLRAASTEELNTAREMMTWGNNERMLTPAHVVIRPLTHIYSHQGQILAMCRLMGKPASGMDFPIS
ncbi:MAG: DinB family protein [Candidatus Eisenbacteria bacterium]|uniref:DinB family protein n=1 Tax=Eiseniibacteriota bacterium TaxID=2212470 RepID=A0A948RWK0_UNCEI|nr:DinB family protein [Candidatus Eisenbacteria bacterium]MBU1947929.1 DinB family protein [Candidatus Eisenbacteria bacterium]MBU2692343.1 DinB family protein [Candidatus Eisenbacteria bacterium]